MLIKRVREESVKYNKKLKFYLSIIMFILLASIVLLTLCITRINFRKIYLAFKIPGPLPLPFLGNALMFFNKTPAGR